MTILCIAFTACNLNLENKKVEEDVPEHMAEFFKGIMPDFVLIIYEMFNPICPYCGSKLHRHEIKEWEMNKKTNVYKQRYKCTNNSCLKTITTELPNIVDKNCNYTKDIKQIGNIWFSCYCFRV